MTYLTYRKQAIKAGITPISYEKFLSQLDKINKIAGSIAKIKPLEEE